MIILDGGMGQELVKRAGKATDLWSMQALLDMPGMRMWHACMQIMLIFTCWKQCLQLIKPVVD
jgi:S-methylmethionine-dependent homocysteine/selenocysteine methylase